MIRNINRFLSDFESISSKYDWYLDSKERGGVTTKQIRGIAKDERDKNEYDPLTAYVKAATGTTVSLERFDKAASMVYLSSDLASQIVDACDEWPSRGSGYRPRKGEKETRRRILEVCGL